MPTSAFGAQLRTLRKRARLTQRDLAIATNYSESQICRIEQGARAPDLSTLVAVFVPALGLNDAPDAVASLLEQAALMRGDALAGVVIEGGRQQTPSLQLPAVQLDGFVGRAADIERVCALLATARMLSILGPPGVGKTSLAQAVLQQLRDQFADGARFVALAGTTHAEAVPDAISHALQLRPPSGETAQDALPRLLANRRVLLVLDNLEHLTACAPWLGTLLEAAPGLSLLITSRQPLRLKQEQHYPLAPLLLPALAPLPTLEVLEQVPSVRLFLQCARAVNPELQLTPANALSIAALCHRLDGLPLAIEMAAARTRLFTPQALLKRLVSAERDGLQWLETSSRNAMRHRSLQAAVQWSFDLLSPQDQRAFVGLGVFSGGFDDAAALAVAGCSPGQLQVLADASLLQVQAAAANGEPRFVLLETLRRFAQAQLSERKSLQTLQLAHLHWAVALAQQAEPELSRGDQAAWMARLQQERDNLNSALAFARDHGHGLAGLQLANALFRHWLMRSASAECLRWLEQLLPVLPASDSSPAAQRARAGAFFGVGAMKYRQSDAAGALADGGQSARLWEALGDEGGLADALNLLGVVCSERGDYARSEAHHTRVLALRERMGDRWGIATSLNNLGLVARHQAQFDRAEVFYRRCLVLRREMRDTSALAITLMNIGDVTYTRGDYAGAMGAYQESLHLRRDMKDGGGVSQVLTNIGVIHMERGDDAQAEACYLESLGLARDSGDRRGEAITELDIGLLAMTRVQHGRALHHFEQALALAATVQDPMLIALVQSGITECLLHVGQPRRALQLAQDSLRFYHAAANALGCADALEAVAICVAAQGDCIRARRWVAVADAQRNTAGAPRTPLGAQTLARALAACPPPHGPAPALDVAIAEALAHMSQSV